MVKLTYQEINRLVNRTKTSFYIDGLPKKDCKNEGIDELYDRKVVKKDESIIIEKHYDSLVMTRDFKKRGLMYSTVVLLFIYIFSLFYIFVQMSDRLMKTQSGSLSVFILFLIVPAIFFYPITRKKIFLYQVIGYKVYALCDVVDGKKFILQILGIMACATILNVAIAQNLHYDMQATLIACALMGLLISTYLLLIMTRVFTPGHGRLKFNHKIKLHSAKNTEIVKDTTLNNIDVINEENVELEETPKDIEEINTLVDKMVNEEIIPFDYDSIDETSIEVKPEQFVKMDELSDENLETQIKIEEAMLEDVEVETKESEINDEIEVEESMLEEISIKPTVSEMVKELELEEAVIDDIDINDEPISQINDEIDNEKSMLEDKNTNNNTSEINTHMQEVLDVIENKD